MKKENKSKTINILPFTTIIYIIYRILFTIPNDITFNIIISIIFLILETTDTFFYIINILNKKEYNLKNEISTIKQKLLTISTNYYKSFELRIIFYLLIPLLLNIYNITIIQGNIYLYLLLFSIQYIIKKNTNYKYKDDNHNSIYIKKYLTIIIIIPLLLITNPYIKQIQKKHKLFVSYNKVLKVKEGELVNSNNIPIQLRGISTHNLYWFNNHYNYDNLKNLKNTWNINVFRIAMYTNPKEEGYIKNKYIKEYVKKIIDDCIKLDIYVIVDWHILYDNNPQTYEKEATIFFNEISQKYSNVPNVIYEICNEPNGNNITWEKNIKPYAKNIIKVIRKNSKKSLILVGTPNWSKDIEPIRKSPLNYDNIMYIIHAYQNDTISQIKTSIKTAKKEKIPIFVSECGATDPTGDGKLYKKEFKDWIAFLEKNNISWIIWQLSDKKEGSSLLLPKKEKQKEWLKKKEKTKKQIKNEKYDLNNYLSKAGKLVKNLILKYTKNTSK